MADKHSIHIHIKVRRLTIQALYQNHITGKKAYEILAEFNDRYSLKESEARCFKELLHAILGLQQELNQCLEQWLDRPIDALDPITLAVLQLGCYELKHRPEIPWKVVINEAVELAKLFGATHTHKYINSILDRLAQNTTPNNNRYG